MKISDPSFHLDAALALPQDEVHLWQIDLDAVSADQRRWRRMLSSDELARAARFHFHRDREHFTATRACLRIILAHYVGSDPSALKFHYSEREKPALDPKRDPPFDPECDPKRDPSLAGNQVEFNVSHSGARALLAFARSRAVGVDIEQIRDNFDPGAIAGRFFSEHEQRQLEALAPPERFNGFFRCWTRKEAYIKAHGAGLSLPLDQFDVSLRPGDQNALLATRPQSAEAARWSLREVPAEDGYVAALCVQGQGWRLRT
jgi:4'-phosphopantetheinyl transferase